MTTAKAGCSACLQAPDLGFTFTMAFQPILDVRSGEIFANEALVRGTEGQGAAQVFKYVNEDNRYRFDQECRVRAIELAARRAPDRCVSINFMPNAVYSPERCIRTTLEAAHRCAFPREQIIFEFTEGEEVVDTAHLKAIVAHYRACGFRTAIDDFGAGYSGLNLLAELQTDIVKIDMGLIRHIHRSRPRQAIVRGIVAICAELSVDVIAEGIECAEELAAVQDLGIHLCQGFHLGRPAL